MVNQAFRVLTEFRFDIGHAVAGSQTLQSEVGKISDAADQALGSFQRMGMGIVAQMGLGSGGVLGFFLKAVQASDKFYQSQLKLSNIMMSNQLFTGENAFERSMVASESALNRMAKAAREFSLPATDLVGLASQIGAVLTVKKLDDSSLSKSTDLSRQFLKSAPILGVDPGLATQQLVGAISGRAEMGSTLVQRLVDETGSMKGFSGQGGLKKFNALEPAKRLDVLTKALAQFSSNVKVTESIAKSMSGQMRRLNDNLLSMFSILKPIGNALMEPIKRTLNNINNVIETHGAELSKNIAVMIQRVFEDPKKLIINLMQMRELQGDVKKAGGVLSLIAIFQGLNFVLGLLGVRLTGFIVPALKSLGTGLIFIGRNLFAILPLLFRVGSFIATKVFFPLMALTMVFQTLSRAIAKAKVAAFGWWTANAEKFAYVVGRMQKAISLIFAPFTMIIEFFSDLIAMPVEWFFKGELLLDLLNWFAETLEEVAMVVITVLGIIQGAMYAVLESILAIKNMEFKGIGKRVEMAFMDGFGDFTKKYYKRFGGGDSENAVSQKITNIDKIEINNQFKEQMEPDRIAFTMRDQFMKAAASPSQARGRSQRGAFATI